MSRICLLALIGLPAAGKTRLSNWLLQHVASLEDWNLIHLCYDNYFDEATVKTDYKNQRKFILNFLEELIDELRGRSTKLRQLPHATNTKKSENYLVICDDNHYYRSMRYKLYQLCCSKNCIYAQIHIETTLEHCLSANKARGSTVPQEIIHKMVAQLEPPDSTWECHNLSLTSSNFEPQSNVIIQFINSLTHKEMAKLAVAQPKQPQLQSISHQLDLLLRARIQKQMNDDSMQLRKELRSRQLNQKRKEILSQFQLDVSRKQTVQLEYYVNLLN